MINPISETNSNYPQPNFDVCFVTSDAIATGRKYRYRFATGGKLILFKHILLSSIFVTNKVTVIENRQKVFQLQLSTFINFQLQIQQNRVINYNYTFSKPAPGQCNLINKDVTTSLQKNPLSCDLVVRLSSE